MPPFWNKRFVQKHFLKKTGNASIFVMFKESSWLATFGCCLGQEGPGVGGQLPGPPVFSFFRGRYLGRAQSRSDGGNCTVYFNPSATIFDVKMCVVSLRIRGWIMLLVVRVLLLVEVPQTVGLVHKRFPSLLVQLFPPAIKTFKRVPSKLIWDQKLISFWVLVEIRLLSPFLLILPPLVPWHSTEPCEPFLTEVLPPTTSGSSARSYLAGHTNPLPNIPHRNCMI